MNCMHQKLESVRVGRRLSQDLLPLTPLNTPKSIPATLSVLLYDHYIVRH